MEQESEKVPTITQLGNEIVFGRKRLPAQDLHPWTGDTISVSMLRIGKLGAEYDTWSLETRSAEITTNGRQYTKIARSQA